MKKFCIKNGLVRNSLLSCVAALTIGTGLMINYQTVKADDASTEETSKETQDGPTVADTTSNTDNNTQSSNTDDKITDNSNTVNNQQQTTPESTTSVTPVASDSNLNSVTVDKDNFNDYFTTHGSATYDQNSGIVTLTPDQNNKVGNFTLNEKIDLNQDFTLKGQVNLGNKTQNKGGADGMGFAFHTGNTDAIGNAGGNMGIGGLQNAIGFKLDTYHNNFQSPGSNKTNAEIDYNNSNDFGWSADPSGSTQFGSFVYTTSQQIPMNNGTKVQRWWADYDKNSVQKINDSNLDGQFHDFSIEYVASDRTITITYYDDKGNPMTWNHVVPNNFGDSLAFSVTSSTGGNKNLHQFKLESLEFSTAATVNVRHIDYFTGKDLVEDTVTYPNGAVMGANYETAQKDIPNYVYVGLNNTTSNVTVGGVKLKVPINVKGAEKSLPASGTMDQEGNNGTVVYVYMPIQELDVNAKRSVVNETIHYLEQGTNDTLDSDYKNSITFLQGTKDGKSVTLYHNDEDSLTDPNAWHNATEGASFNAVKNPTISGYHVVEVDKNDADPDDLSEVELKYTNYEGADQEYTVYYTKNSSEGGNGGNTDNPDPEEPTDPENPTDPEEPTDSEELIDLDNSNDQNNNNSDNKNANSNNILSNTNSNFISKLPQTGNKKTSWLSYLGAALIMFIPVIFKKH